MRARCRHSKDPHRPATPGTVALQSPSLQPRQSRNDRCSISAMPEGRNSSPRRTAQPAAPPGSCTMMDGVKWSAGEGKHAQRLDSGELPPAGTQWANKPRPAGRAGSPISCPIKKQIEQPASYRPPVPPHHLCQPETTRRAEDVLASSLQLLSRGFMCIFQSTGHTRAHGNSLD